MRKSHVIVVAALVAAGAVLGTFALTRTTELGVKARDDSKKSIDTTVTARTQQLDALERSLQRALAKKPPKLPPLSKIQTQAQPAPPAYAAPAASAPRVVSVVASAVARTAPPHEHEHSSGRGGEHDD